MPNVQEGAARYLYLPAAVAAIGGLLFGFDTAVINGAIVFLKSQFWLELIHKLRWRPAVYCSGAWSVQAWRHLPATASAGNEF